MAENMLESYVNLKRITPIPFTKPVRYCTACNRLGIVTEADIESGDSAYCLKHYRIRGSRYKALERKKLAPSLSELEALLPADMLCPVCTKVMCYAAYEDTLNSVISLQHWHDGTVSWICHACNTSHGNSKLPENEWLRLMKLVKLNEALCGGCSKILPLSNFHRNSKSSKGIQGYCKSCGNVARIACYHNRNKVNNI
mgnify:CR=1 FL=1|tara:strand:+ start:56 stop:649 length:594 start_codon:yes stop_codon:yes gene_type:complete